MNNQKNSKDINSIVKGDAIRYLETLPDDSVDMAFADPPFNLKKRYNHYDDKKSINEYLEWCKEWLCHMVRITKPSGSIFVHNIPKWLTHYSCYLNEVALFRHWIAWDAMGTPLGKTILPNHYGILWYVKSKDFKFYDVRAPHRYCRNCKTLLKDYGGKKHLIHPFGTLVSDVWTDIHRIRHAKRRDEHPCQLPVPLLERLILMTTDKDDLVLDPFIGTGTSAIAAKRLGRKYIGIDIDDKYVEIAAEKLAHEEPQKVSDCYCSIYLGKIQTLRDKDYSLIEPALQTVPLIVGGKTIKELRLPYFKKQEGIESDSRANSIYSCVLGQETVEQPQLLEERTHYSVKSDE